MDRQVLNSLATLEGFLDGHAADVHPERRAKTNQYLADVAQENVDRQTRNADLLDPSSQATRNRWNATQVSNHEKLFSIQ